MDWIAEHQDLVTNIFLAMCGYVASMIVSYIKFGRDLSYIKGQVDQIVKVQADFGDMIEKHAKLELDFKKTLKDLDRAFLRLKVIEASIFKGDSHVVSS